MKPKYENEIYRWMQTPHKIGRRIVYQLFSFDGIFCGFRCRRTNSEIRKLQNRPGFKNVGIPRWYEVHNWEFKTNK